MLATTFTAGCRPDAPGSLHSTNYGGGTEQRDVTDKAGTLGSVLANLGQEVLSVVSAPRGLDVEVGTPTLFDQLDASSVQPGDVVLGVGVAARPREAVGFVEEAGAYGASAVILKLGDEAGPELIDASTRTGVALLARRRPSPGGTSTPCCASPVGRRCRPGRSSTACRWAICSPSPTPSPRWSAGRSRSKTRSPTSSPTRAPICRSTRPAEKSSSDVGCRSGSSVACATAGVFQRLQTTDDVVTYVDQEEEVLPRLAVGIRAGGELLGSIWVAEATESLGPDAKAALQEAGRMAALHLIRHRSSSDLERRQRGELVRGLLEGDVHPDAPALLGLDAGTGVTVVALRVDDPTGRDEVAR